MVDGLEEKKHVLAVGENFPDCRMAVLSGEADREYLGLPPDTKWLELAALNARFVLIQLYNTMCNDCVAETRALNRLFDQVESDPILMGQLKIIGLGIYDDNRAVVRFKRQYNVNYPLFSDKHGQIFECLGQAELPLAYLVRSNGNGSWTIELVRRGYFEPDGDFLQTLRQAVARSEEID